MSSDASPCGEAEHLFHRSDSAGTTGTWLILGGVGGLCLAAVGFAIAVVGRPGTLALHSMSTLPAILSIGALTAGRSLLGTPDRVAVGRDGITVETKGDARHLRWDEIGHGAVETGSMSHRRHMNLTDLDGKSIVKLDQSFERFDDMVAEISRHVEARADDTATRILRKKAHRQGAMAFVLGSFLAFACIFVAWTTREEQRGNRLLQEQGQPGEGEILRRFTAPNGVTKRLEYRVVGTAGRSGTRNVEVEPAYWDSLGGIKAIPVIFIPDEPGISRLAHGERKDDDVTKTPAGGYGLAAVGGAMALFFLAISPLMWNGWDLDFDSEARKWSLKRLGKVVWSSRSAAEKRPPWLPKSS